MTILDDAAVEAALARLTEWHRDGDALVRTFKRRDWLDAVAFVDRIAPEAERRNHHPDVLITGYRNVTIRLTTHSEGGISQRDVDLAHWIEEAASGPGKPAPG